MTGMLLSADDPRIARLIDMWAHDDVEWPNRAAWLKAVEDVLRELHPTANSDSLTLTARTLAPFPLQKPGVP